MVGLCASLTWFDKKSDHSTLEQYTVRPPWLAYVQAWHDLIRRAMIRTIYSQMPWLAYVQTRDEYLLSREWKKNRCYFVIIQQNCRNCDGYQLPYLKLFYNSGWVFDAVPEMIVWCAKNDRGIDLISLWSDRVADTFSIFSIHNWCLC